MLSQFLNPLMLLGLAGIVLPVLVHLLSRRRFDVVDWGAMQFLELGRNTRRKMKLEQLLLMLLRIGLIALVVLAMARPWARGGLFSALTSTHGRDVVLVIDGSYSMGWQGDGVTPHAKAVGWAHRLLEELGAGDTVALIDAREQPHAAVESLTHDFSAVRQQLNQLASPTGTVNLPAAFSQAARILNQATNVSREIIVLSDGQARGWSADDTTQWARFDVLREEVRVRPSVWIIDVNKSTEVQTNFSLDRLQLSREVTVPAFPVRVHTRVGYAGVGAATTCSVFFEVDGQRLDDQTIHVKLEPGQETDVEFEHRFNTVGSHIVSVVLEDDHLPADNRADAVVTVADAISLLLVDGSPHPDATQRETYFATSALTAKANETPWVRASVITADELGPTRLRGTNVVVLANVPHLTETQAAILEEYVTRGGGLLISPGDKVDAAAYNTLLYRDGTGLLPAALDSISAADAASPGSSIKDGSLESPWLKSFRNPNDGGLTAARFNRWWKLKSGTPRAADAPKAKNNAAAELPSPPAGEGQGGGNKPPATTARPEPLQKSTASELVIDAQFENGDPFLVSSHHGRGGVILMTAPLDADWSTLPAKPDYVSLLHELVFHLVSSQSNRNVDVGMPLILPLAADLNADDYAFVGPDNSIHDVKRANDQPDAPVQFADTRLPGIYRFDRKPAARDAANSPKAEYFAVNCDRSESDLRALNDRERETLAIRGRMTFVENDEQLKQQMLAGDSKAEYWHALLLIFVAILVGEVALTRQLVKGGHAVVDASATTAAAEALMSEQQLNLHGLDSSAWAAVWLLAVLAAAVLIVVLLRYERKLVSRRIGYILLAFRLGLLGLLAWTFSQPVLSWTFDRNIAGRIVVAVDVSDSMATEDAHASQAEKLRWARALGLIGNDLNRDRLDEWISAYEAGREPNWVDESENAADKKAVAAARQEHLQDIFAQVDALSRKEIATQLLAGANQPLLSALSRTGRLQLVAFAGGNLAIEEKTLAKVIAEPPAALKTGMSALSQALGSVASAADESPLLGVVVLSDGRDNSGQEAVQIAQRLGQAGAPVFPVMFGSQLRPRDLSIASLDYPQSVSKDDKPVVTAVLNTPGFGGEEIVVKLERDGGDTLEQKVAARDQTAQVQFQVDAADVGRRNYTVRVEPRAGETRADNNSRSFAMSVVDDKIRVLLIDGEARWEFRFIDNALSRDPNVEVRRVVFRQPYMGVLDEPFFPRLLSAPQPDGVQVDSPFDRCDLVVLGDVAPDDLSALAWEQLDSFVTDDGGTLVFVAGKQHFPLGFSLPVVDRLLPLTDLHAAAATDAASIGPPSERGFHLALTHDAEKEVMFQFADNLAANREAWTSLPGHSWGVVGKAKPAATVFAEAVGMGDGAAHADLPANNTTANAAVVHQFYGAGQVLYIGIDSTWRWRHRIGDTYHHRFWGQMARWAAENRSSVGNDFVQFGPEQTDVEEGSAVTVRARWSRPFLKRFPGLEAKAEISRSDAAPGTAPIATVVLRSTGDRPQVAEGRVADLPVGDYRVKLVAANADLGPAEISAPLYVTTFRTPELSDVAANPQLLTQLAQAGGGQLFLPDQMHELPQLLARPENLASVKRDSELWNHWIVLVLFVAMLTTEWVVRKLHGLP